MPQRRPLLAGAFVLALIVIVGEWIRIQTLEGRVAQMERAILRDGVPESDCDCDPPQTGDVPHKKGAMWYQVDGQVYEIKPLAVHVHHSN